VDASVSAGEAEDGQICLEVHDTGIGIPELKQALEHIAVPIFP
jgi:signal transduction histidine kinase